MQHKPYIWTRHPRMSWPGRYKLNTFFTQTVLALQPEQDRHTKVPSTASILTKPVKPHAGRLRALQEAASALVKAAGSAQAGMAAAMRPLHAFRKVGLRMGIYARGPTWPSHHTCRLSSK